MIRQVIALALGALYQVLALFFPDIPLGADDFVSFILWILAVLGAVEAGTMAMVRFGSMQYKNDGSIAGKNG